MAREIADVPSQEEELQGPRGASLREEGQGVIEYALVVGGVSIVLIVILATSGTSWIGTVTTKVSTAIA